MSNYDTFPLAFNVINYVAMIFVLAPGLPLRAYADHIEKGKRK
jgi:hypothetical protein